tara:strand:- start:10175 stop:11101 length:927 start_codon:yes stop_codon:yes gene_type:complete
MNYKLSPIVIFSYNRIEPLIISLNALKKNSLAQYSDVILYSDGYKEDKEGIDEIKVNEVRCYLKTFNGFGSFTVVEREKNYGLAQNIIQGVSEIINSHGSVIVLEDDLVTSCNFLSFMNQSLEYYKNRNDIFSVSGHSINLPSLSMFQEDTYLLYRPSSWGWATWKDQWNSVDWMVKDYKDFISDKDQIKKFNTGGVDMTKMLKGFMEGKNNSWAIRWSYAMHKQNKYCVYPTVSKVNNIGFGPDGTHCKGDNIYDGTIDEGKNESFHFSDMQEPNYKIAKEFKHHMGYINKFIKKLNFKFNNFFHLK